MISELSLPDCDKNSWEYLLIEMRSDRRDKARAWLGRNKKQTIHMYLSQLYINIDPTGQSSQKELCILTHDSKINDDRKNEEKHKVL